MVQGKGVGLLWDEVQVCRRMPVPLVVSRGPASPLRNPGAIGGATVKTTTRSLQDIKQNATSLFAFCTIRLALFFANDLLALFTAFSVDLIQ